MLGPWANSDRLKEYLFLNIVKEKDPAVPCKINPTHEEILEISRLKISMKNENQKTVVGAKYILGPKKLRPRDICPVVEKPVKEKEKQRPASTLIN